MKNSTGYSRRRNRARRFLTVYEIAGFAVLYLPLALLVLFSFNKGHIATFRITGLSLRWWKALYEDVYAIDAAITSFEIALVTTVISTTIGTLAAFPLVRLSFKLKKALNIFAILPMLMPEFLIGISLLIFYNTIDVDLSFFTIVAGHVVYTTPFTVLVMSSRLYGFDRTLESAAADLGADGLKTFRYVTFPIIFPGILSAALLAFTLSLDQFLITFFTSGPQTTLPLYIWSELRDNLTPKLNALATVIFAVSFTALFLIQMIGTRKNLKS